MLLEIVCIFKGKRIVRKQYILSCISHTQTNQSKFRQKKILILSIKSFLRLKALHVINYIMSFISNTTSMNWRMLPSSFQVKKIRNSKSGLSNLKHEWKYKDVTVLQAVILTWHKTWCSFATQERRSLQHRILKCIQGSRWVCIACTKALITSSS